MLLEIHLILSIFTPEHLHNLLLQPQCCFLVTCLVGKGIVLPSLSPTTPTMMLCRPLSQEMSFRYETMTRNQDSFIACLPFVSIVSGMALGVVSLDINIRSFSLSLPPLNLPQISHNLTEATDAMPQILVGELILTFVLVYAALSTLTAALLTLLEFRERQ